ncbi:hypothetical protein ICN48_00705 [Polynucleobacter sp. JS-Safj-400b-B2]|uniref:hypothetical protein n=1 Tax=Polynucleobacter sp. JS-Safj-400b-B2 TaxID=2576921 RepID=UPI001C0C6793|nr:hypothetical protein [Polynucleobacter sp. JS-Safj-400b-B2]MBU3624760.1 hypothetical protein [Polynucleobacter sp. JS-Safj-400b-B2]
METSDKNSAIFVLTGRGFDTILNEGGSQAWRINTKRASTFKYVVCIQNHNQNLFDPKQLTARHHAAFMVGKLKEVVDCDEVIKNSPYKRKLLVFSEYAKVDAPNQWPGNRNPVTYKRLEDLDIDIEGLEFKPMPFASDPTRK